MQQNIIATEKDIIDYSGLDKKELLRVFKSEYWKELHEDEKMQIIQAIGDIYSNEWEISERIVFKEIKKRELCCKWEAKNIIYISFSEERNPYQILDMIIHEIFHIHQKQWEESMFYKKYQNIWMDKDDEQQGLEIESSYIAANQILSSRELFLDDIFFKEYLEERVCFFEKQILEYSEKDSWMGNCISKAQHIREMFMIVKVELKRNYFECMIIQNQNKDLESECVEKKMEDLLKQVDEQVEKFEMEVLENDIERTPDYWQRFGLYNQFLLYQMEMLKKNLKGQEKKDELEKVVMGCEEPIQRLLRINTFLRGKKKIALEEEEW